MKTICNWAALAAMLAPLCAAQAVQLTVPAVDMAGNAVPIGAAYVSWGQFKDNSGIIVQAGSIARTFSNGVVDVTLTASDNAGYVYTVLLMKGSTPNTFRWRVPAAGAATMAELNESASADSGAGSGSPAGVEGSVQFKDGAALGGSSDFVWSNSASSLLLSQANGHTTPSLDIKNASGVSPASFVEQLWRTNEPGFADFGLTLGYL